MKIMLVNKFHFRKGGGETYYFELARALRARGHEVVFFSTRDARNEPCEQEGFFAREREYDGKSSPLGRVRDGVAAVYSAEARDKFDALLPRAAATDVLPYGRALPGRGSRRVYGARLRAAVSCQPDVGRKWADLRGVPNRRTFQLHGKEVRARLVPVECAFLAGVDDGATTSTIRENRSDRCALLLHGGDACSWRGA